MVADLTAAGLVQGFVWQSESPWMDSVNVSQGFWMTRSLAALPVAGGFVALCLAMLTGPVGRVASGEWRAASEEGPDPILAPCSSHLAPRWLQSAYVLTAVAGVGFFVLSFVVLAVWPNQVLEAEIAASQPTGLPAPARARCAGGRSTGVRGASIAIRSWCA